MKLGSKIILSFACISLLIAAVGLVSNWYTSSIQRQLLTNNVETTRLVQYTANIEKGLYQSLVFLVAIKEADQNHEGEITLDEPTVALLSDQFNHELMNVRESISSIKGLTNIPELADDSDGQSDLEIIESRFSLYEKLTLDWLLINAENPDQAKDIYNTSISPYFRNQIIPVITHFREHAVDFQNQENNAISVRFKQANIGIRVLTFICVLLSLVIAFYIYRSIADPLKKLNKSAFGIGKGNLDERIEIRNNDEIGELAAAFNEMTSNLKKRTMARDYLDNIIETIQEALIVTDENKVVVGMNKAALKLLHYPKEEALGLESKTFYDLDNQKAAYESNRDSGTVFEFTLVTKRGNKIPVLFSESKLINAHGECVGTVAVATDITQRRVADERIRKSLKEKEVLLSEIHHRVKNNLAVISGILQLQIYETKNVEVGKALMESQSRIQSISLVHEMLYHSDSLAYIEYDSYVSDLLQAISGMHMNSGKEIKLKAEVEKISLDLNQAIPCSLLLNEVIVNCYKHAFSDKSEGNIKVTMTEDKGWVTLKVEDDGIGIEENGSREKNTLGLTLINTLVNQLKGSFSIEKGENGTGTKTIIQFGKDSENPKPAT